MEQSRALRFGVWKELCLERKHLQNCEGDGHLNVVELWKLNYHISIDAQLFKLLEIGRTSDWHSRSSLSLMLTSSVFLIPFRTTMAPRDGILCRRSFVPHTSGNLLSVSEICFPLFFFSPQPPSNCPPLLRCVISVRAQVCAPQHTRGDQSAACGHWFSPPKWGRTLSGFVADSLTLWAISPAILLIAF